MYILDSAGTKKSRGVTKPIAHLAGCERAS